jgi:hypothetical protein
LIVPTVESPPLTPSTLQVTVVLEAPVTPEVKDCVYPVVTLAVDGLTDASITVCGVTVTVPEMAACPAPSVTVKT